MFHREGSVYVTRSEVIRTLQNLYGEKIAGYEMPEEFSSNIDTLSDWQKVEERMSGKSSNATV